MNRPMSDQADPVGGTLAVRSRGLGVITGRAGLPAERGAAAAGPIEPVGITLLNPAGTGAIESPLLTALVEDLLAELLAGGGSRPDQAGGRTADVEAGVAILGLGRTVLHDREQIRFAMVLDPARISDGVRADLFSAGVPVPEIPIDAALLPGIHDVLDGIVAALEAERVSRLAVHGLRRHLSGAYEQLSTLYQIGRMLNNLTHPLEFVESTVAQIARVFEFDWIAVQYIDAEPQIDELKERLVLVGESPIAAEVFSARLRSEIERVIEPGPARILKPGEHDLADAFGVEILLDTIQHDGTVVGALIAGGRRGDDPDASTFEMQLLDAVSDFMSVFHQNTTRFAAQRTLLNGTVRSLSAAIDAKDPYTHGHSERVGLLTARIAEAMGWSEHRVERAHLAGILHDVGKIGVRESVLCKAGSLTDEEFDEIKRHPVIGNEILRDIPPMKDILPGVLHHHERIDGRGYPEGLVGDAIPEIARVIAVADGFDAMSSDRAYRAKMPRSKVLDILREGAGTQWDAAAVAAFLSLDLSFYDGLIDRHQAQEAKAA